MEEQQKKTLRYFKSVLERDKLISLGYSSSQQYWTVDQQTFYSGSLDKETTVELFSAYLKAPGNNSKNSQEIKSIPLLASLKVVRLATSNKSAALQGLLNIECSLACDGTLSASCDDFDPWLPADRMGTANGISKEVMVGTLADYWKVRRDKQGERSRLESWQGCIDYANSMFSKLKGKADFPHPDDDNLHECVEENLVYLMLGERILASSAVVDLYDGILQNDVLPATLESVLRWETPKQDARKWVSYESMSKFGGCMSKRFFLADSQRTAVHAYVEMGEGDVLAVSGPPGTGKTTMLQAVVASLIVKHAVEGKPAPVIVGSSTNNQAVTNIISSFSSVVPNEHGLLDYRWLIKAPSEDGGESDGAQETLGGIAAYCPAMSRVQAAVRDGYLVESVKKDGVYTKYSAPKYVDEAKVAFLEYARKYMNDGCLKFENVSNILRKRLCALDGARRAVIKAAADLINSGDSIGSSAMAERFATEAQLAQGNFQRWLEVESKRKKRHLWSRKPTDDTDLIIANRTLEDDFPFDFVTIDEVKQFYKARFEKAMLAEQNREVYDGAYSRLLSELQSCTQDSDTVERAKQFDLFACDDDRLLVLDQTLDVTVRYVEFWLAVHYYEAQWLEACTPVELIKEEDRIRTTGEVQDKYWSQVTALTPCMVMTEYQLPKYFTIYDRAVPGNRKPDYGRIDLMVVDEAGQVNTPVALPSFALAKRALVVGDVHQLAPVWSLDPEEDKAIAMDAGLEVENWDERGERGLVASAPGSLMRVAANASKWSYDETLDGLFLEEHYRCVDSIIGLCNDLIYKGKLKPCRGEESKLSGKGIAPVQFVVVPGSRDESAGSSRRNLVEAQDIVEWISKNKDYLENIYEKSVEEIVGVVTPFSAQAHLIQGELAKKMPPDLAKRMTVGTAHRLQGAERPVILFSLVYGDESGTAGFVESMPKLMNVAISRAKDLFVVFGSAKRTKDEGKVLKVLVKGSDKGSKTLKDELKRALESASKVESRSQSEPEPKPELDADPNMEPTPGPKSISQIVAGIDGVTGRRANQVLKERGLIKKAENGEGWRATAEGLDLGIIEIAPHDDVSYYMCKYGENVEKRIVEILKEAFH